MPTATMYGIATVALLCLYAASAQDASVNSAAYGAAQPVAAAQTSYGAAAPPPPAYGPQLPVYQPQPPPYYYPTPNPYARHNYDVNYCSVHGSFPLVGFRNRNHRRHHDRHHYERYSCRYSAIFDQESCDTCCKVASRNAEVKQEDIVGALFVFDPRIGEGDRSDDRGKTRKVVQCVCCAPKRF